MYKINKVNAKKNIATMKLMLALGLTAGSTMNVKAAEDVKCNYRVWGSPEYESQIHDALTNLPDGLQEYLRDVNVDITILEGENDAETVYAQEMGYSAPGSITGLTIDYADGKVIYVEGTKHSYHYQKYIDSNPEIAEKTGLQKMNFVPELPLIHYIMKCGMLLISPKDVA